MCKIHGEQETVRKVEKEAIDQAKPCCLSMQASLRGSEMTQNREAIFIKLRVCLGA